MSIQNIAGKCEIRNEIAETNIAQFLRKSRDISVMDWLLFGRSGFDSRQVQGLFLSSPSRPELLWGLPNLQFNGHSWGRALSLGVKRPEREANR